MLYSFSRRFFSLFPFLFFCAISAADAGEYVGFDGPSMTSAFYDQVVPDGEPVRGWGGFILNIHGEEGRAELLGVVRAWSPLALLSAVSIEKVLEQRDNIISIDGTYMSIVLSSDDLDFLSGAEGALVESALPTYVKPLSRQATGFEMKFVMDFVATFRCFNYSMVRFIQSRFERSLLEAHLDAPDWKSLKQRHAGTRMTQAQFTSCVTDALDAPWSLVGDFARGCKYESNFVDGKDKAVEFVLDEGDSWLDDPSLFTEVECKKALGNIVACYILYAGASQFHGLSLERAKNPLLATISECIKRCISQVFAVGKDWEWVKDAHRDPRVSRILPQHASQCGA